MVQDGGTVSSVNGFIGRNSGSLGEVEVKAIGSVWSATGSLYVGGNSGAAGGTASLNVFNHGQVSVGHTLHVWSGATVDVSDDGVVNVGGGDTPSLGTLRVGSGGTLSGNGTIVGDTLVDGGRVAPGHSPGILHINGDYTQNANSVLEIEVGGRCPASTTRSPSGHGDARRPIGGADHQRLRADPTRRTRNHPS